jgi:hypothetical protein
MSNPTLTKNYTAEGAVAPHRIVALGSADYVAKQGAAATDAMFGVSDELAAADGERFDAHVAGMPFVEYGGNVTRGDPLTSDANGKAITATRHTHTENTDAAYTQNATTDVASNVRIIGHAQVSGVDGDIGIVHIAPGNA